MNGDVCYLLLMIMTALPPKAVALHSDGWDPLYAISCRLKPLSMRFTRGGRTAKRRCVALSKPGSGWLWPEHSKGWHRFNNLGFRAAAVTVIFPLAVFQSGIVKIHTVLG